MNELYEPLKIEIITFETEDVIVTSDLSSHGYGGEEDELND